MEECENVMAEALKFMESRVIITAAELDFFTVLDERPATSEEVAAGQGLDSRATARVLDCLVALGLLDKKERIYRITKRGACLSARYPGTVLPMVKHMIRVWKGWSLLTETVREGSRRKKEPLESTEASWAAFIEAMHVVGSSLSAEIAESYDLSRFIGMLDIGGASGTYTVAFLRKNPAMKAVIFDIDRAIPYALKRIEKEGLSNRVSFVAGDFHKDELPGGCDLALLSAVIHQNSPEENRELYKKAFRALESRGTILIRDHIMDESRTKPPAGAFFALNMLVNTPGGDTYTFRDVQGALQEAGFVNIRLIRTGERMDCLVEAQKPF